MALTVKQAKVALSKHKDVIGAEESIELYRRSYVGGSEYRDGEYLIRHSKENKRDFERRVKEAVYTNYSAPIVDIMNSYLFRERPQRSFGAGADSNPSLTAFIEDADSRGRSFASMMRETSRWSSTLGHMGVVVDKPISDAAITRADELNMGVRPYMTLYSPEHIINWGFVLDYMGPPELRFLVLREQELDEDVNVFRIWFKDSWEMWAVKEKTQHQMKDADPELIAEGVNPLGMIPFVLVPNKDSFDEMSGVSDLTDIAEINRYIYRLDSAAMEIIERTAFPFLEVPIDPLTGNNNKDVVVGTGNVLERDVADPTGHRWLEPSHSSLQRILEWRTQAVGDIKEIAKMGTASSTSRQGAAAFSGAALDIKFQQLNAVLAAKATTMEHAEVAIMSLAARWENVPSDVSVRYPRKFGIRDVSADLDTAIRSKEIILSPAYDKLIQKSIASRSLSDLGYSQKAIELVEKDIDAQPYVPAASKLTATGGMNGISVIQTKEQQQIQQLEMQRSSNPTDSKASNTGAAN